MLFHTIFRILTTRLPPFLSPPTGLVMVARGISFFFFSICVQRTGKTQHISNQRHHNKHDYSHCVSHPTFVSGAVYLRLYRAFLAYMAEREYLPMPRARVGLRLAWYFFTLFFLSPVAFWLGFCSAGFFSPAFFLAGFFSAGFFSAGAFSPAICDHKQQGLGLVTEHRKQNKIIQTILYAFAVPVSHLLQPWLTKRCSLRAST